MANRESQKSLKVSDFVTTLVVYIHHDNMYNVI